MLRHSVAIAAIDLRILRRDPAPLIVMTVLPLLFVPFLMPGAKAQLAATGHPGSSGAEYAVPALAVLFALLCVQQVLAAFHREREWHTWSRLAASPASLPALLLGKSATAYLAQLLQLLVVLAGGALLYGFRPKGSMCGVLLVAAVFSLVMIAFGLMLVPMFRVLDHAMVTCNLLAMLMAGLGGAFGPVAALPEWMQLLAPASPSYWALTAMSALSLDGASLREVLPNIMVMLIFVCLFSVIAALVFRLRGKKS